MRTGPDWMKDEMLTPVGRTRIWKHAILPLLSEYFYNRQDRAVLLQEFALDNLLKLQAPADAPPALDATPD
ncbi:MAG: hypothetical protein M3P30_08240 [Chloroflexota bacterium]|nr:hypothetical protein [Chloroflexota bacterium]